MRGILVVLGFILGAMVVGLGVTYGVASMFDWMMGTNTLPLFLLAGSTLGMVSNGYALSQMTSPEEIFGQAILLPVLGVVNAVIVSFIFPGATASFLEMVSYEGSIFTLALAGAVFMGIVNVIWALILGALQEAFV